MKKGDAIVVAIILALAAAFIIGILSADIPTWLKWLILFK